MSELTLDWWMYPAMFAIGVVASFMNSLAGGGSTLSIPFFLFLGIPVDYTMGTNRVGIFMGNISSTRKLIRSGEGEIPSFWVVLLPVVLGTLLGTYLIIDIGEEAFKLLFAGVLVFTSWFSMRERPETNLKVPPPWQQVLAFFCMGIYGGSIQAGMGFILMALMSWTGLRSLVQINTAKGAIATLLVFVSVLIFVIEGKVLWSLVPAFCVGTFLGGWLGAKMQLGYQGVWLKRGILFLTITIAVKLVWEVVSK